VRSLSVLGIVALLGLAAPVLASAGSRAHDGSTKTTTSTSSPSHQSAQSIDATFHEAVISAQQAFESALAAASSSAQRSTARQTLQTAIIQAAATRSSALAALGSK
jgi:hypothetical protein